MSSLFDQTSDSVSLGPGQSRGQVPTWGDREAPKDDPASKHVQRGPLRVPPSSCLGRMFPKVGPWGKSPFSSP